MIMSKKSSEIRIATVPAGLGEVQRMQLLLMVI